MPMLELSIGHTSAYVRAEAHKAVRSFAKRQPKLASTAVSEAFKAWVQTHASVDNELGVDRHLPIGRAAAQFLSAIVAGLKGDSIKSAKSAAVVEQFVVDVLVPCHARIVTSAQPHCWVDLALDAGLDPGSIAAQHHDTIMVAVLANLPPAANIQELATAAYAAVSTLVFIAPTIYVPLVLEQATQDLDPQALVYVGDEERGIWGTPEGTAFVDGA